MNTHTLYITIGRNIGDKPMSTAQWFEFKSAIMSTLESKGADIIQRPIISWSVCGAQFGIWKGKVCEDAATFVAFINLHGAGTHTLFNQLKTALKILKGVYQQEAIGFALIQGTNNLI